MTPRQRRRRLNALSKEHTIYLITGPQDCALEPCGSFQWMMAPEFGVVAVSHDPASSDEAYLVALHEIGHGVVQRRGKKMAVLAEEAAAWRWAVENAGFELEPHHWAWLVRVLRNDLDNYATEHFELMKEAEEKSNGRTRASE